MTPAEKADELVTKYRRCLPMNLTTMLNAKNCALIAVDELLILASFYDKEVWDYLEKVKQEIEQL